MTDDILVKFSYSPERDYELSDKGKSFLGCALLNHMEIKELLKHANACDTLNYKLEIHIFGKQTPEEENLIEEKEKLVDEITRLKNAMTTAHTAMIETHRYFKDTLKNLTADKGTIWTTDVRPILTKLARSIETMAIWGFHE